ncbi:MAG: ATP-dependent RNA helicase HrpA [Gammaproteobacteria bacterium]|nr:ATP-dependent RNA helicase HrpA [Gammaproteobacteria bacterium]
MTNPIAPLRSQLSKVLCRDYPKFLRELNPKAKLDAPALAALQTRLDDSVAKVAARAASVPAIRYPELPVVEQRDQILDAIKQHQVIIVCADTGSGKTTQLPKICLEAGRGTRGFIGHTQPRRIAARTVSQRIAEELQVPLGQAVGYKVRFNDVSDERSLIKVMTDGILLAEIQRDPFLNQYDTLIIDEAHERSLNIDFLLGYLKRLLPKRKDLKLIITSATIDPERFARHFGGAPMITAEGRTYPVEVRYRPPAEMNDDDDELPLPLAIVQACEELQRDGPGDVLVFLPGERDIREAQDALSKAAARSKALLGMEILPLLARLSNSEQQKIFQPHNTRRIVLATNVAETSLTVPGIRYVVDSGLARISRYSVRSKVQRLPIEAISQASAKQRAGRCGRTMPGICVRLYSEEDFNSRDEFTQPEILRTNLASVILQMEALRLGAIDQFPFVEPPEARFINDGYRLLHELGAVDEHRRLTKLGKQLAKLPVDPRFARMLIAAGEENALSEALTIVAMLSIQDPRERPMDRQKQADEAHADYQHEHSDFLAMVNLWQFVDVQRERLSNSQFRKMCQQRCLSWLRLREWRDVRAQLAQMMKEFGHTPNEQEASYESLHRALLTGLLGNIAMKQEGAEYLATRNRKLHIFPGSGLAGKGPKWMMAAEISETSRLYARGVAKIEPEWLERLAEHLVNFDYYEPTWLKNKGFVGGRAKVTLYGLVINPKKNINYGSLFPEEARQIFIQQALVDGNFNFKGGFYAHNQNLVQEIVELEEKQRRRDILVSPEELYAFYDALIPEGICSTPAFEKWRKPFEAEHPRGLYFAKEALLQRDVDGNVSTDFPDSLELGGAVFPVRYHFSPGSEDDGVTALVPVSLLNRIDDRHASWLVPGLLKDRVIELIRALPKATRKHFVPAPDYATACVDAMPLYGEPLFAALTRQLEKMTGVTVGEWDESTLSPHLKLRFEVLDGKKVLGAGRDLALLQTQFSKLNQARLKQTASNAFERDQVDDWNFGDLPETVELDQDGVKLQGYPALTVEGEHIALRVYAERGEAAYHMHRGVHALYARVLKEECKYLKRKLPYLNQIALRFAPFGDTETLKNDLVTASIYAAFADQPIPRTREDYQAALSAGKAKLIDTANRLGEDIHRALEAHRQVARKISGNISLAWVEAANDMRDQIAHFFFPNCFAELPVGQAKRLEIYFKAMDKRLQKIDSAPDKDRKTRGEILPLWEQIKAAKPSGTDRIALERWQAIRWKYEELRVAIFAQELGAQGKVNLEKLQMALKQL